MPDEHALILNGSQKFGKTGTLTSVYNPADGITEIGRYHRAEELHIELIERAADNGFKTFQHSSIYQRAEILENLAKLLEADIETFTQLIVNEVGKPIQLARSEVERSIQIFKGYARQVFQQNTISYPVPGYEAQAHRFPMGPVLAITPFNFPLSLVAHKLAPAIATGCSITIKPSPLAPLCALRLGRLAAKAGYEAINVIPADDALSEMLVKQPVFKKISFTGSAAVGRKIRQLAGHRSLTLELGGNAAVIVEDFKHFSPDKIATRIAYGAFSYAGQICISVQRILINEAIKAEFMPHLVQAARNIPVGDPKDPKVLVGPMISMQNIQRSRQIIKDALKGGGNVVYGGNTFNTFTLNPTLLDRTNPDMTVNTEEAFAPIATIQTYKTFDNAIAMANQSRYGIQAGVYTHSIAKQRQAFQQLEVSGVLINEIPTFRADLLPYGGIKESGQGHEGILAGMEDYTFPKVYLENLE